MRKVTLILNGLTILSILSLMVWSFFAPATWTSCEPELIIGGADGPTAIFIATPPNFFQLIPYVLLIAVLMMNMIVLRRK